MRQIAGGSQSGLRKFFQQYPSLFTIEGEMVCITQTGTGKGQVGDISIMGTLIMITLSYCHAARIKV